jgi:isopentenyldiphosphate isomerase
MKKKPASKRKKFRARPGQVDFTNIRWAPVINCVVMCQGKMLLVERDPSLHFYPGYWNGISGFLDDKKDLKEKVMEELREELGIKREDIISIVSGEVFDQDEPKYKKTWIVHPVLVRVKTVHISLDWEARKYKWVKMSEAKKMKLLPGFDTVLQKVRKII